MWAKFAEHLPTVLATAGFGAFLAAGRSWQSSARLRPRPNCFSRLYWSAGSAVAGATGAAIFAGASVEAMHEWPWLVASLGGSAGVAVDVFAAHGTTRIIELALRYARRVSEALRAAKRD